MSQEPANSPTAGAATFAGAAKPSLHRGAVLRSFSAMKRGHLHLELPEGGSVELG